MRTFTLMLLVFAFTQMFAQPYQITFTGSGLSTSVTTVEVQNLTQGTTLTLNGTDILELVTNIGIEETVGSSEDRGLSIYPNPVADECLITFENPQSGMVSIEIINLAGQLIIRQEATLQQGVQAFSAGGLQQGLYIIQVKTSGKQYTNRLISLGSGADQPFVRQVNNSSTNFPHGRLAGTIQMQYNTGDMMLFKGISGIYSRVVTLLPTQNQNVDFEFIACTDGDGNHYPVVTIGTQTWMAENLKTTKYNNSNAIPLVTDDTAWTNLSTPAYCWYENDYSTYGSVYGALYNWFAVETGNLCPTGWHVPTDAEWTILTDFLGGENVAGGPLKEIGTTHWNNPNTGATNSSGFTALPGGYRYSSNGNFNYIGSYGYWWSSSAYLSTYAWTRILSYDYISVYRYYYYENRGRSVRCVRDSTTSSASIPTLTTDTITSITSTAAVGGGTVTSDGGAMVTVRGVCVSTSPYPITNDYTTINGSDTGSFTSNLIGLSPNTTYYVRAYATNSAGTGYGNQVSFSTPVLPAQLPVYDIDGNGYDTVQIGTQVWLKQNLKTTRYRNATTIPNITANSTWAGLSTGARCWYNNDSATYAATYGALYNWYAVDNANGLCPIGWHVPTDAEWTVLTDFLGGLSVAGGPLKETDTTHWNSPNIGATNSSGFTALPGGSRGGFNNVRYFGYWWSSSAWSSASACARFLNYNSIGVFRTYYNKKTGFSVRCVRDL